jgi:molybdopterin-containing oxidoreductase family iron-sulfur binding subunit
MQIIRKSGKGLIVGPQGDLGLSPLTDRDVEEGNLSRRNLLLTLGMVGVGTAGAALGLVNYREEAHAAIADPSKEHQWCRIVDLRKCVGERKCVAACQTRHGLPDDQTWMRVLSWKGDNGKEYFQPVPCQMCENPPCVAVCPVSANFTNLQGVVLVDQNLCVGSRACMAACPYEARYFNWSAPAPTNKMPDPSLNTPEFPSNQIGTVGKCVLCADRIPFSKELPACVAACPRHVHYIGDFITDVAVNGVETVRLSSFLRENNAVRFKEELGTSPRTFYILGNGQPLGGPSEGVS